MAKQLTIGLMLMDNDPKMTIEEKVLAASQVYQDKHGVKPDTCCIYHELTSDRFYVDGIVVLPVGRLIHHLLIGVAKNEV